MGHPPEVVVVGAGVIGASAAYHLKRMDPERSVLLLDMNRRLGEGNTARSAALYRNIFSSATSKALASSSIRYYIELGQRVQLDPIGYLWLFSEHQWRASESAISSLDPASDRVEHLDIDRITSMFKVDPLGRGPFPGIARGLLGSNCGSLSGMSLAQHYGEMFRSLGGEILTSKKVLSLDLSGAGEAHAPWARNDAMSVTTEEGETFRGDHFLFATGAWTHGLLSRSGIFTGVLPKKRQLFGVRIDDPSQVLRDLEPDKVPAMILPAGGTYIKPMLDRKMLMIGLADDLGRAYSLEDAGPEVPYFEKAIMPVLSHYFPDLRDYEMRTKWSGHYSYHWPDKNPVVESVRNITWASGTSGSGIMKADAVGRIAAAKVLGHAKTRLFDGSEFRVDDLSLRDRRAGSESFVI